GVKGGAVYGASDRIGAYPASDPVTPGDLAATLFWRLGVDPEAEVRDLTGRPYRLADGEPLRQPFPGATQVGLESLTYRWQKRRTRPDYRRWYAGALLSARSRILPSIGVEAKRKGCV